MRKRLELRNRRHKACSQYYMKPHNRLSSRPVSLRWRCSPQSLCSLWLQVWTMDGASQQKHRASLNHSYPWWLGRLLYSLLGLSYNSPKTQHLNCCPIPARSVLFTTLTPHVTTVTWPLLLYLDIKLLLHMSILNTFGHLIGMKTTADT